MYQELQIIKTDYPDKFLIKHQEKTMYVGYIIKDIVEFLIRGNTNKEIQELINSKHNISVNFEEVNEIIEEKIKKFVLKKSAQPFIKLCKLFNPNSIKVSKLFNYVFELKFFYLSFIFFVLVNTLTYCFTSNVQLETIAQNIVFYFTLLWMLFLHEIGHAIAAKKYNSNVTEIGFGIYYILPVFYIDLNESWKLARDKRIVINLSGIYMQLFMGMVLLLLSIVLPLYKNILLKLFISNFAIVLLNLNPFLKFDGYWVLSDLINENDLNKKSNSVIKDFFKFKINKEKKIVVLYSFLKMIFIGWILYLLSYSLFSSIISIIKKEQTVWQDYLPLLVLGFFFYRLFKSFYKRTNYVN